MAVINNPTDFSNISSEKIQSFANNLNFAIIIKNINFFRLRGKDNQAVSDKERLKSLNDQLQIAESEVQENQQRCVTMAEERARETLEFKNLQEWYKEVCLVRLALLIKFLLNY